jgi:hypothetical protein
MRAETGFIRGAYTFGSMAVMAPLAAIYMKFLNLSIFDPSDPGFAKDIIMIAEFALVVVAVNVSVILIGGRIFGTNPSTNFVFQLAGFLLSGALAGGILAFALFEQNVSAIVQGVAGGIVAALLIGLMVPRALSRRLTETLTGPAL